MGQGRSDLRRRLGLVDATAIALGAIIGAGVFVVLGEAAGIVGTALPLAVLIAAAVAFCDGLSAAELGVSYPEAGGPYEFGYVLISPVVGFTAGWIYLFANLAASTTFTLGFASYLQPLVPSLPLRPAAVALAILALAVNLVGVQQSGRVNDLLVAFKVVVLLIFIGVGLALLPVWRHTPLLPFSLSGLPRASALIFFAYAGFARIVLIAGEVRDPTHTLPRAVIASLVISTVLYLIVAVVALGLAGPQALAGSPAPLRTALEPSNLTWAETLVSLGGLVATSDVLLTNIWGLSRLLYAMAGRGDMPSFLHRLDSRRLPRNAVLIIGLVTIPLVATVGFGPALLASSLGQLAYYGIMNVAALRLRPIQRLYPGVISWVGLAATVGLAASLPLQSVLALAVVVAVGLVYYVLRRRARRDDSHEGGRGSRP